MFTPASKLANPTALVGTAIVNGVASTAMRSDAAPPIDQTISPTWVNQHVFLSGVAGTSPLVIRQTGGTAGTEELRVSHDGTNANILTGTGDVNIIVQSSAQSLRIVDAAGIRRGIIAGGFSVGDNNAWVMGTTPNIVNSGPGVLWGTTGSIMLFSTDGSFSYTANSVGITHAATSVLCLRDGANNGIAISARPLSPTALGANTNNYAPGPCDFSRWSASTPVDITGLVAGQPGERKEIWNTGTSSITLTNQDAASTAGNRWLTSTGANITLAANQCALCRYDNITAAWRVSLMP